MAQPPDQRQRNARRETCHGNRDGPQGQRLDLRRPPRLTGCRRKILASGLHWIERLIQINALRARPRRRGKRKRDGERWAIAANNVDMGLRADRPNCLMPRFDGALLLQEWKEAFWDKFVTGAPRPHTPSEQQYTDCKLRSQN